MKVGAIHNGVVIDHITAGKGMDLYHFLNLDHVDTFQRKGSCGLDAKQTVRMEYYGSAGPSKGQRTVPEGAGNMFSVDIGGKSQLLGNAADAAVSQTIIT